MEDRRHPTTLHPQPSAVGPRRFARVHLRRSGDIRDDGELRRTAPNEMQWWSKWWSRSAALIRMNALPSWRSRMSLSVTKSSRLIRQADVGRGQARDDCSLTSWMQEAWLSLRSESQPIILLGPGLAPAASRGRLSLSRAAFSGKR